MRELMLKVEYLKRSSIYIGKVGESNSTRIKINATYWRHKFSNISFKAIYRRADGISYPVNISTDGNYIIWDINRKDLYKAGTAYFTLAGYELDKKVISTTAMCFVNPGINGITIDSEYTEDPTPTDWIQSVLDEVGGLKNSIYAEIESAISSAGHLKREIVDELPDLDAADKDTIYMIKRVDSDNYIEYIVVEAEGIKRFEQIGSVQADWNQNDETKIDFIKNKPVEETEDDAMEMLTEMGLINPVMDEENNILTDEDGNIFTTE